MKDKMFKLPKYNGVKADLNGYYANRNKKNKYRIIYRFSYEGKFIKEYKFNKKLCDEHNFSYCSIKLAATPTWSDKRKGLSSMNSIWIFKEDYSEEELQRKIYNKQMDSNINSKINKKSKKIVQKCVETNEIIHIWDSINQAGKEEVTGYKLSSICRVLYGDRHKYAGCTWEFLN